MKRPKATPAPAPKVVDDTRCVHCPNTPATHIGCLTGKRICERHTCVECKPIARVA